MDPGTQALSSDERFSRVFDAVAPKKAKKDKPRPQVWQADDGVKALKYHQDKRSVTLTIDKKAAPDFGEYLLSALPEIYASFKKAKR